MAISWIEVLLLVDRHRKTAGKNGLYDDRSPVIRWRFPHQSEDWFGMTCSDGPANSNLYSSCVKPICTFFVMSRGAGSSRVFPVRPAGAGSFLIIALRQKKASRTGQVFHSWPCDTTFRSCLPAGEWCRAMPGFPPEKKRKKRKMYFYAIFAYTFNFERFLSDYAHFSGNFREIIKKV